MRLCGRSGRPDPADDGGLDWAGSAGAPGDGSKAGIPSSIESRRPGKVRRPRTTREGLPPTVAQAILETSREIPAHAIDDGLTTFPTSGGGRNAPLVSNTVASVAQDASTYLVPPGSQ